MMGIHIYFYRFSGIISNYRCRVIAWDQRERIAMICNVNYARVVPFQIDLSGEGLILHK